MHHWYTVDTICVKPLKCLWPVPKHGQSINSIRHLAVSFFQSDVQYAIISRSMRGRDEQMQQWCGELTSILCDDNAHATLYFIYLFNVFLFVNFCRSEIIKIDGFGWCFENVDWESHGCNYELLDSKVIQFYTMRCIQIIILPCIYVAHDNTFFAGYERDGDRLRWCSKRILRQGPAQFHWKEPKLHQGLYNNIIYLHC